MCALKHLSIIKSLRSQKLWVLKCWGYLWILICWYLSMFPYTVVVDTNLWNTIVGTYLFPIKICCGRNL